MPEVPIHRILGEQNANLPRILGVLAAVLARGTDLAGEDTLRRMVTLLQHMRSGLPPQVRHVSLGPAPRLARCGSDSASSDGASRTSLLTPPLI